ncbi:RNA-directed DNA polymerase [Pseudolabrys taiwanensis]|uniref:RNA-directed DNA polymerase n=1 Tax=Pseudolabrys taiwanensis TaxID=331696 RepID=A0A345ZWX6_9HYPH|nr:reverse transcriptase domain-containing protein [Pseudolabrys taiwanensis]AXK81423.1 RNA-directed DNA polymerase [Pseudolabrys taiwanensis]
MKKVLNAKMALLALGVLQPASAREVRAFLKFVFPESGTLPDVEEFEQFLREQESVNRVVEVERRTMAYYSLTLLGSLYLPPDIRKKRDKFRAYLLRDARRGRFIESRELGTELAGVSPASDTSTIVKGRAANNLGRSSFGRRFANGQAYWPRIQGQFITRTGPTRRSRDTFPNLLSFQDLDQAKRANGNVFCFDYSGIGLCLGLSPQLVWNISRRQSSHYRAFPVAKKGGGTRLIESPRVFLKVIQWFLNDFVLHRLPVHDAVHSFRFGRSIATNAECHKRSMFVGNVDIENFFGTITEGAIISLLTRNNFAPLEAMAIAKLCPNWGALPQGAPTSPIISNALLYDVDKKMSAVCEARGLAYTRYADDISISGPRRRDIADAIRIFEAAISDFGLKINQEKTRIAHRSGQQRVTGVVVNEFAQPSRAFRKLVRAKFHAASVSPDKGVRMIPELGGILGYLKIFPSMQQRREIASYGAIIKFLKSQRTE